LAAVKDCEDSNRFLERAKKNNPSLMGEAANACLQIRTLGANRVPTCEEFGIPVAVFPDFCINFLGNISTIILPGDVEIDFVEVSFC